MKTIVQEIERIRRRGLSRRRSRAGAAYWQEKDYLGGEVAAGVIILPTRGCSWGLAGGCAMCGYVYDSAVVAQAEVYRQFKEALSSLGDIEYLKIFNSGSFFDRGELEGSTIARMFAEINRKAGIKRVQVEARPEFIKREALEEAGKFLKAELEVGIGLESSSDYIRENCINKGFSIKEFKRALKSCRQAKVKVKAYILVKPPFLTEREAIEDAVASARDARRFGASRISFNPTAVHKDTLVEYLWRRREYSPPWLWSLVEILRRGREKIKAPLLCHPSGAGKARGAHNCGRCDSEVYKGIIDFSATQDIEHLDRLAELRCRCRESWRAQLELEQHAQGSFPVKHRPIKRYYQ
jgi:hypothetical protein